jgi:hypothetical protein
MKNEKEPGVGILAYDPFSGKDKRIESKGPQIPK